jgi:hypothetical protein
VAESLLTSERCQGDTNHLHWANDAEAGRISGVFSGDHLLTLRETCEGTVEEQGNVDPVCDEVAQLPRLEVVRVGAQALPSGVACTLN